MAHKRSDSEFPDGDVKTGRASSNGSWIALFQEEMMRRSLEKKKKKFQVVEIMRNAS
jgi:hypothetical protein